jgi:hypothetical protein
VTDAALTPDAWRKALTSLEGMQRRVAKVGYGRNAGSTEATMDWRYRQLQQGVLRSDAVCDDLDNDARLAARWSRAERRYVGLPA